MPSKMDHIADKSGAELARLAKLYNFPDFVKTAEMGGTDFDTTGVATEGFADLRHRQFPCHTKVACWLSTLYFLEKQAEFHPSDRQQIEHRLDRYAAYWHIKAAVDDLKERHKMLYKAAEASIPDSSFAYVWVGNNGRKERRLPLLNTMHVKVAAEWLEQYRDSLPFTDRHTIAKKILEKAAKFGAGISKHMDFLEKQAGRGVCDPNEVVQLIRNRASLITNPGLRIKYAEMADMIQAAPRKALQPGSLIKLAETLDKLDRDLGFVGKYAPGIDRPEDVLFKATFAKVAEELHNRVPTTTGNVYNKEDFSKLALDDLRALFGDEFAERVTSGGNIDAVKLAEEVQTLPRPDAQMFDGLMADNKLHPVLTKAASARQGLSPLEVQAWADAYATVR